MFAVVWTPARWKTSIWSDAHCVMGLVHCAAGFGGAGAKGDAAFAAEILLLRASAPQSVAPRREMILSRHDSVKPFAFYPLATAIPKLVGHRSVHGERGAKTGQPVQQEQKNFLHKPPKSGSFGRMIADLNSRKTIWSFGVVRSSGRGQALARGLWMRLDHAPMSPLGSARGGDRLLVAFVGCQRRI